MEAAANAEAAVVAATLDQLSESESEALAQSAVKAAAPGATWDRSAKDGVDTLDRPADEATDALAALATINQPIDAYAAALDEPTDKAAVAPTISQPADATWQRPIDQQASRK